MVLGIRFGFVVDGKLVYFGVIYIRLQGIMCFVTVVRDLFILGGFVGFVLYTEEVV